MTEELLNALKSDITNPDDEKESLCNKKVSDYVNQPDQDKTYLDQQKVELRKWSLEKAIQLNAKSFSYTANDVFGGKTNPPTLDKKAIIDDAEKLFSWVLGKGFKVQQ